MLIVEGLKKYYGKNRGVVDVTFSIDKGEIYGLIGPNGAGKTTTIRIILGLIKKDSGNLSIDGKKIPEKIDSIKNKIGYLPGEVNLYPDMKVDEFLKYNWGFYKYDKVYEKELCDFFELDTKRKFKELSQGNKKKVGIVQALAHKPDYLILDEPTNGLDPLLQKRFYKQLEKERNEGKTILFSSHNLNEVEMLCDRVGIIKDGITVKEMSIAEIGEYTIKKVEVIDLKINEELKRFDYRTENENKTVFNIPRKELKEFLSLLSKNNFSDIQIRNPSLEETFMDFYG